MRSYIAILLIQSVTGFSSSLNPTLHHVVSSSSARSSAHKDYFDPRPAILTFAFGWAMGSNPILALDHPSLSSSNNNDNNNYSMMSNIPTLAVSLSDSDYADFSLPSYKEVSSAEINTNLKGSKQIFSDSRFELTSADGSSAGDSPAKAAAGKTISAADSLSDKTAAKIAAKAARERQLQAVEAAAAAK